MSLGFPGSSAVKQPPARARAAEGAGSIPVLQSSQAGEVGTHSSILAWEIPRAEKPGGLQSIGHKESDTTDQMSTHAYLYLSIYLYTQLSIYIYIF